jgi:hypothetical protein
LASKGTFFNELRKYDPSINENSKISYVNSFPYAEGDEYVLADYVFNDYTQIKHPEDIKECEATLANEPWGYISDNKYSDEDVFQ